MTIDNAPASIRNRKQFYLGIIGLIVFLVFVLMADFFETPLLGLNRFVYASLVVFLFSVLFIYRFILDYNYINYSNSGDKIVFKYYSLRPLAQKRQSIEITKNSFAKYELKSSFFGRKKTLILYQKISKKLAKYPPISLSALNDEQIKSILTSLNSITR